MVDYVVEFDYTASEDDELTLRVGDIITNVVKVSDGWCQGNLGDKRGMFPDNFVKELKKEPKEAVRRQKPTGQGQVSDLRTKLNSMMLPGNPPVAVISGAKKVTKKAKVMHEYSKKNEDELNLVVGQIIEVLKQEEEGWWEGTLNGVTGMFPSNFVELVEGDEADKAGEDAASEMQPKRVKGVGFGNIFGGGPINLRPTAPGSKPAPAATERKPHGPDPGLEKGPAGPPVTAMKGKAILPVKAPPPVVQPTVETKPVVRAVARFGYEAANDDELSLNEGDIITVLDQNLVDPGWWKGELKGRVGVFPDNFVDLLPAEEHKPAQPARPPGPVNGGPLKTGPGAKEPLARMSSIPTSEPPPPPQKVAPKVPDARPQFETDDHKAKKNNDVYRSDTLDRAVGASKPLKPMTADRAKLPGRRPPSNPTATAAQQDEKPAAPSVPLQVISEEPAKKAAASLPSPLSSKDSPIGHAADLADLQAEVSKLRSDFEQLKRTHEKRLLDLTSELDEEKKTRLNLQVEIERLKKRLAD